VGALPTRATSEHPHMALWGRVVRVCVFAIFGNINKLRCCDGGQQGDSLSVQQKIGEKEFCDAPKM